MWQSEAAETVVHSREKSRFTEPQVARASDDGGSSGMKTMKFTYWKDGNYFLGFWNDYPDYQTQGLSKDELVSNLKDLLADLQSGEVPYIRKVEELVVAE